MERIPESGFQLGVCRIEPGEQKIISANGTEHVEPRVMDVLMVLVGYAGQTVSREDLIERVWATRYIGDEVLSRCISLLRKHLGDNPRQPRYIETVPKKGYRLIANVSKPQQPGPDEGTAVTRSQAYDSIAVLPFANLSASEEYEYFSDGMAEELMTLLAKVSGLKVAARTSAFFFKDQNVDIRLIGERLGVDAVLMGSVRHAGNQIRISTQLLDTVTGYHIWSEIYNKTIADIFTLQIELSSAIVNALRSAISAGAGEIDPLRDQEAATSDFKAYQLYLQGKFHLNRRGEEPIRKSIVHFQAACERDPGFAHAYTAMAKAHALLPFYSGESLQESLDRARDSARRALALDDRLGKAHAVLAFAGMHQWQWREADRAFQRALELQFNDPYVHQWYGQFLSMTGSLEQSFEQIRIAHQLDPISPAVNERLAFTYLQQGNNELAREQFHTANSLGFQRTAIVDPYILVLWRAGQYAEMEPLLVNTQKRLGLEGDWAQMIVQAFREPGDREVMFEKLTRGRYQRGLGVIFIAAIFVELVEVAYALAGALIDSKSLNIEVLLLPEAQALRADRRFPGLLRRLGLHDYWTSTSWPDALPRESMPS